MLYFGDAELVEKHLHEDLNTIIKNVKIRQEQHLELLQYNKAIANKKRSIENTLFINDEITMHNKFLQRVMQVHEIVGKQQNDIIQKYDQASVKFQSVIKLMSRVVTRIIETNHTFIDKIKSYDQIFIEQFSKMKSTLTKLINNKELIDLSHSTKTIIEYTKNKATNQIDKLKQLIKTLEDGDIQKVPFIYKGTKPPEPKISPPKIDKPIQKKSSPPKKQQKHQIVAKIKNEIKAQQNAKKHKKNLANKLATMYSTMDLNKKDFIQDIVSSNPRQFNRIYGQILIRNKFNQVQILEFQNKKQEFQEKVKLFKEMMIQQSNKIQQVLMIKKPVKIDRKNDTHSESASKIQMAPVETEERNPETNEDSNPAKEFKRAFILRQKANSPKFHKETEFTQLRITQDGFNHIKFDSSNQEIFLRSNRNRLPIIQSKQPQGVSVSTDNQHRYQLSKPKEEKSQIRKNFLMKNIELGVQNVIKQNQSRNQSESKNIAEKLREIQPANASINNVNLMQFTFYGSKKKSFGLGETKNSFVF